MLFSLRIALQWAVAIRASAKANGQTSSSLDTELREQNKKRRKATATLMSRD
jgi:hypothetical protein